MIIGGIIKITETRKATLAGGFSFGHIPFLPGEFPPFLMTGSSST